MKKRLSMVAEACRDEADAAFQQAKTSKKRAQTLRTVAAARRKAALEDDERADGLRREAMLSEREAVNHEDMARVFEAEAHRAQSQAWAEESIAERRLVEKGRRAWQAKGGAGKPPQPAKQRSKAFSKASGKRETSTSGITSARR